MPAPKPTKRSVSSSSGAYFMPTVTRTHSGPRDLQPAHTVMQHVPSLRRREEVVTDKRLKEQYTGSRQSYSTSQKSLFSALDHSEKCVEEKLSDTQIPSYQTSYSGIQKPQTKKKIIIKKRASETGSQTQEACTEVSSKVSMLHVNSAESYIAEVKSILSAEHYKMFSKALVQYKKDEDIEKCVETLAALFTEDTDKHHLFAKFYRFVRAKHKKTFHETCLELTGLSTGYKAEDSVSRKRLQESLPVAGSSLPQKKQKTEEKDTKGTKVSVDASKMNVPVNADIGGLGTETCSSEVSVAGAQLGDFSNKENTSGSTESGSVSDSQSTCSSENIQPVKTATDTCMSQTVKEVYSCCACRKEAKLPFISQCKHVCCMQCWREVFEGDKLCPTCKLRVRRRHLTRLVFEKPESRGENSVEGT